MSELQVGDHVIAARCANGSSVLTGVEHRAEILSFTRPDRYGRRLVTLKYDKHIDNFPDIDTIKMQSGKGGNATVLAAPFEDDEVPLAASQSSVSSVSSEMSETSLLPETQTYCAEAAADATEKPANGCEWKDEFKQKVPMGFKEGNALTFLRAEVPDHIKARWLQVSPKFVVQDLFANNAAANNTLRDVRLTGLKDLVGATEYTEVPVKTGSSKPPHLGLIGLFAEQHISGRCTRARQKGLMFFYLMCRHPEQVLWPDFQETTNKRRRSTPFSLSEIGRLVAIIADPKNGSVVSMLFQKWDRQDLDAKAGKKGVAYYWEELAKRFNDKSYVPQECPEFADHVASCGTESTYSTDLVPEYRNGQSLRNKWTVLRANYALFHSKYSRSGHNEPDPTMYTTDLQVLLMHYTFNDTPFESWAAKTMLDGAIDDDGDGHGDCAVATMKKRKKTVHFSADTVIASCTVYETLATMKDTPMTEDEVQEHKVRMRRAAKLMDRCLDKLEGL